MSGDVLAMQKTCSDGDASRCWNVWFHEKTHTRDVLTSLRATFGKYHRCIAEYSAMHRGRFGD